MRKMLWAAGVLVALGMGGVASAAPIIDMGIVTPTAGTISYAGGSAPLVGSGISVDNVVGLDTPSNDGVLRNIIGGVLNFTSGAFASSTPISWDFGSGGSITVNGGVDLNNNGSLDAGDIPAGTLLLSGSFTSVDVLSVGSIFKVDLSAFTDVKDDALTAFYGTPDSVYDGALNLQFTTSAASPGAFTSGVVLSGDITNTISVPEPGSAAMLLAPVAAGVISFKRRRKNA